MYIYGPSSTGLICIYTVRAEQGVYVYIRSQQHRVNMYIYGPSSTGLICIYGPSSSTGLICIYTVLAAQG